MRERKRGARRREDRNTSASYIFIERADRRGVPIFTSACRRERNPAKFTSFPAIFVIPYCFIISYLTKREEFHVSPAKFGKNKNNNTGNVISFKRDPVHARLAERRQDGGQRGVYYPGLLSKIQRELLLPSAGRTSRIVLVSNV